MFPSATTKYNAITSLSLTCILSSMTRCHMFYITLPQNGPRIKIQRYPSLNCITNDSSANKDNTLIRYRGRVAYDGTGYDGWQVQSKGRTVQGEIQSVLSRRFNRPVTIVGAGRTDAGVHARGQAFHFDLYSNEIEKPSDIDHLQHSMNSMLRHDTRVYNLGIAPDHNVEGQNRQFRWHAILSSSKKRYSYRLRLNASMMDPQERYTRAFVYDNVDVTLFEKVLRHFEGDHDFRAFAGAVEQNERRKGVDSTDTVRRIFRVDLVDEGNGDFRVDFLLEGALYKMVRNMVGTALDVSKGLMTEDAFLDLLHQKNGRFVRADNPCKPAPPEGLTLMQVFYKDGF